MRVAFILFAFFIMPYCCLGQSNTLYNEASARWHWGISASVDYIKFPSSGVLILDRSLDIRQSYDDGKAGFSIGPYLSYQFSKRLEGQVGAKYMKKMGYVAYKSFSRPDFYYDGASILQLDYLSIPVSLKYYLFQQRNAYFVSTGLSIDHSFKDPYLNKKVAFSHTLSLGGAIKIDDNLLLLVEPVFQYALSDYMIIRHSQGIYRLRPYAFGIQIGIRKHL